MTDRDVPRHSASDFDLTDGNALVIGLHFWCIFGYLIIHGGYLGKFPSLDTKFMVLGWVLR